MRKPLHTTLDDLSLEPRWNQLTFTWTSVTLTISHISMFHS